MTPTRLTLRGVTRFDREMTLELSGITEGLIAVVGDNGAGKTTLIECMCPAPIYLEMPTRPGHLADNCRGRDSMIDLHFEHQGHAFRALVQIDIGASVKSRPSPEAYLYRDGEPLNNGKIRTYREAVAAHLPPAHMVLASAFAAQDGSGSFGALDVAGRRKLFRSMLGLDGMQQLADRATLHRRPLDGRASELDREATRLTEDREKSKTLRASIDALDGQTSELRAKAAATTEARDQTRADRAALATELEGLTAARAKAIEDQRRHALEVEDLARGIHTAEAELTDAEALIARGDEIDRAAENARVILDRIQQAQQQQQEIATQLQHLDGRHREITQQGTQLRATLAQAAGTALIRASADVKRARELAEQAASVPCLGAELVHPGTGEAVDCSTCQFLSDATAAERIPALETAEAAARTTVNAVGDTPELVGTRKRLAAVATDRTKVGANAQEVKAALTADKASAAAIPTLDVPRLATARARAPVLKDSMNQRRTALAQAQARHDAITIPAPTVEVQGRLQELDSALTAAKLDAKAAAEALEAHLAAHAGLQGQLKALGDLDARDVDIEARRLLVATRRSGLVLVERAFGPEGIQALEIDAAGPGVSDLSNELLRAVDAPYTIQLRTVREASGGRRQKEVFDVIVHDGRDGLSRELGRMSIGEGVIVEEAIKLAIAVHVSQRSGGFDTIWRDESDGDLSDKNALRYPDMLRAALAMGGFKRCYFITHRPAVAAQADAEIRVGGGSASVNEHRGAA